MSNLGTVEVLVDNGTVFILRWTVDTFLRLKQTTVARVTPYFRFCSDTFYLVIQYYIGSKTYGVDLRWPYALPPPTPFSWKLSLESGDGRILPWTEGVEEKLDMSKFQIEYEPDVYNIKLGSLQDIEGLLQPDIPLVIIFELRCIPKEIAANTSPSLQHPEDVKKSPGQMKNRSTIDGAGKSSLSEPSKGACDEEQMC